MSSEESTSNEPVTCAIVGTGLIAQQHIQCLLKLKDANLVGVCDLSPTKAQLTSERYENVPWFTDYKEMLEKVKPKVVHITTPANAHFLIAKDCLELGANVIIEKPIVLNEEELITLREISQKNGLTIIEDHNYLFNKEIIKIKELIDNGSLGSPTQLEILVCLDILQEKSAYLDKDCLHPALKIPGGVMSEFYTHLASLSYFFLGAHIEVKSVWLKKNQDTHLPCDEFRSVVKTKNGIASIGFSSHSQPDGFYIKLYGTKMVAETNLFEPGFFLEPLRPGMGPLTTFRNRLSRSKASFKSAFSSVFRKLGGGPGSYEGLWKFLEITYKAFRYNESPPIDWKQIEEVFRLVQDLTKGDNTP